MLAQLFHFLKNIIMFLKVIIKFSVVTVIETGTETAVLCLGIDGSVLKWSSSGVLNVTVGCSLQVVSPTRLAGGCYRWDQR